MTEPKLPPKIGRPELPPEFKTYPHTIYFTEAQWAKIQQYGGPTWIRSMIDRAK